MQLLAESTLTVGARCSPLSLAQCEEVLQELRRDHPEIAFDVKAVPTTGDCDQTTSLRTLDKTDFFTKEIDSMLLNSECRIAIHSAKDLPDPLPKGIQIVALTKGVDASDSLVIREGESFDSLPAGAKIGISSDRREKSVQKLRKDLTFRDIRGSIQQRLEKLHTGELDGVVIAEAALIRLGLTHLNRIVLKDSTAELQGKLVVVSREKDEEMEALFSCIDTRVRCLYVGIELPLVPHHTKYIHYPLIRPIPRDPHTPEIDKALNQLDTFSHIILTSKSAVRIFFSFLHDECIDEHIFICVGKSTAAEAAKHGAKKILVAERETAEDLILLLKKMDLSRAKVLWPHSSLSRPLISHYLAKHHIAHSCPVIYDTLAVKPKEDLDFSSFDAIEFTSPSTVDSFVRFFGALPKDKELRAIGPITRESVELFRTIR